MTQPELEAEQRHLDAAYARLDAMRRAAQRVAEGYSVQEGGTLQARLEREAAEANTRRRLAALDIGDTPLCFGRLDLAPGAHSGRGRAAARRPGCRRALLHRPDLGHRGRPHAARRRLAGAGRRAVLPRHRGRADGRRPPPPLPDPRPATHRPRRRGLRRRHRRDVGPHGGGGGRAARRARPGAHRADARHRRHHPGRAGRSDPGAAHRASSSSPAVPAPARPRSRCTAPRTSSTRTASDSVRRGCCSSGPSPIFLRYIDEVLPSLGEDEVVLATTSSLKPGVRARATAPPEVAAIKGDRRMAQVIAAAIGDRERPVPRDVFVPIDGYRLRLRRRDARRIVERTRARRGNHNERRPYIAGLVIDHFRREYRRVVGRRRTAIASRSTTSPSRRCSPRRAGPGGMGRGPHRPAATRAGGPGRARADVADPRAAPSW